ncbi:MAG: type II toxin-antitoxin system MqsA family antitoxin [Betaproteobacteria bacterium]|nr:type II toxin-antitoxin system MqsA family antitoxin [Betaproteobacteria bacterium]MCL2886069.1 type II toxin-antitoxin system MqsA family antitoxin [Betaproteobacteria bacterium]
MSDRFCLQCDDGTLLQYGTRNVSGEVNGEPYAVENITGWHCPVCDEVEFTASDEVSSSRLGAAMQEAARCAKERNAQALRAVRKKLKLSQAEAGRLFGGGASAFSEYERGKTQPHKSTVLLLRLLDKHPELLRELRVA